MGTTAEKLAYLKETKSQIKQALETPSNVMRDYANWIKKYVDNQPTSKVSNGVCTNALDVPLVSLGVDGNSEQKQYSGKNFFNRTEINRDETVNTEMVSVYVSDIQLPMTFSSYIYTLTTSFTNTNVRAEVLDESGTLLAFYMGNFITKSGDRSFVVVPAVENAYKVKLSVRIQDGGHTERTQLEKGTVATDYEPYVGGQPSPNPDYPQDVEVIKGFEEGNQHGLPHGCIGLEQSGKQLFDVNKYESNTKNGYMIKNILKIGQKYTISINNNINNTKYGFLIKSTAGDAMTSDMFEKYTYTEATFTYTQAMYDKDYKLYIISIPSYGPITKEEAKTIKIQLEEGSTVTPYEPYHEPKLIPINLNGNAISKVGDVKDLLKVYRNGDVEISNKIKHIASYSGETILTDYISITGQLTTGAEIYYVANEEIIKLPSISPIELWEGTNNFKLITNLDTTFEMEYVVNKDYIMNTLEPQNLLNIVEGENI